MAHCYSEFGIGDVRNYRLSLEKGDSTSMYKQLYVSHGSLCEGMLKTLKIFVAETCSIQAIPYYVNHVDAKECLTKFKEDVSDEDIVVIFTDILMGSVNQDIVQQFSSYANVHIITGYNLAIALEFAACNPSDLNASFINEKIEGCMHSLVYMNEYNVLSNNQDE